MDWDKLRIFHAAAEAGSFTHAGETLNMSQSAVSRQVSALERELNAPLFHRHARGLVLTEQGELLYRTAQDVFMKLASAEILLSDSRGKPNGDLRVTTTVALGIVWLTPRLGEFMNLYPDIRVQLILNDEELDLGMREADVAIRFQPPSQNDLIRRKLFVVHNHVYASLGLCEEIRRAANAGRSGAAPHPHLWRHGAAASAPHQLAGDGGPRKWRAAAHRRRCRSTTCSACGRRPARPWSSPCCRTMSRATTRALSPCSTARRACPNFETYFVYPEEMKASKRIDVFRDFMVAKAREWSF